MLVHRGRSIDGGHFVAHVLVGGQWLQYDDERVRPIGDADLAPNGNGLSQAMAVAVLYERVDQDEVEAVVVDEDGDVAVA